MKLIKKLDYHECDKVYLKSIVRFGKIFVSTSPKKSTGFVFSLRFFNTVFHYSHRIRPDFNDSVKNLQIWKLKDEKINTAYDIFFDNFKIKMHTYENIIEKYDNYVAKSNFSK